MGVSFSFRLVARGWAECSLTIGEQHLDLTASYLSDALGDLLGAVIRILEGDADATAAFAEEPGAYRLRFTRLDDNRMLIRVLEFPKTFDNRPDEKGKLLLEAECRNRIFAAAVLVASQKMLQEHGVEGYLGQWVNNEFPLERHSRLQGLLRDKPIT
ncbi:MAG: hypothetical protein HY040_11835 [Planctomycetes bacterium]|nr:hypothetical protein [Planctomycetota bacterium]